MIEVFRCPVCNTVIREGAFISKCCVDFITKSNFKWSKPDELKEDIEKTEIQWSNIEDITELPKTSKKLADEHWKYIEGLLEAHGEDNNLIEQIEFHYKTAFIHGYKHAMEEK